MLVLGTVYLSLSLILRMILWWSFARSEVGAMQLPFILAAGAFNDLVELLYISIPVALYLLIMPERAFRSMPGQALLAVLCLLCLYAMTTLSVAEYFFFEEYDARFNLVAVDYLIYPHEVLVNIWESYPVVFLLELSAVVSLAVFAVVWPRIRHKLVDESTRIPRRYALVGHVALIALAALVFSTDTLAFSHNRLTTELAANGVSSLFRAFRTNEMDYNLYYRTEDSRKMFDLLTSVLAKGGGTFVDPQGESLRRRFAARADGLGKLNVVVVAEESFGAEFVGAYGDDRGLTPYFDELAKQGLLFTNAYATGTRTVRGLEAISASFPPIPSEAILKRPGSERIANWGEVMREHGYHASFLYGGYAYFDKMQHFFSSNGFTVRDQTDIQDVTFSTIWGACDQDLFRYALDYFDSVEKTGKPFFSIIMTTSNHKPYKFPAGVPGVPTEGGGRAAGIRYADYALGELFRNARNHSWFDDTLFVVVADHGARVYGAALMPLHSYEIPLLVLAPGHVHPGRVSTLASQMDIAPTVLGMLGLPYEAPFFGQDVLRQAATDRFLLFNHNHDVALYHDGELVVLGLGEETSAYTYTKEAGQFTPVDPSLALVRLATAYFQTAFEQFKDHRYQ